MVECEQQLSWNPEAASDAWYTAIRLLLKLSGDEDAISPARVAAVTITSAVASGNTRPPTAPHRPLHARAEQDVLPRDFDEDELTPRQRGGQSRMENLSLLSKHTNCLNWIT
jgi:hypothetical protein